jgi:hypothetical protein
MNLWHFRRQTCAYFSTQPKRADCDPVTFDPNLWFLQDPVWAPFLFFTFFQKLQKKSYFSRHKLTFKGVIVAENQTQKPKYKTKINYGRNFKYGFLNLATKKFAFLRNFEVFPTKKRLGDQ